MTKKKYPAVLCPRPAEGMSYVYVLGTNEGHTKIGMTRMPRDRLINHHKAIGVVWVHFFGPLDRFGRIVEQTAKYRLEEISERIGNTEIYRGLTKEDAIRVVRDVYAWNLVRQRERTARRAEEEAWEAFKAQYEVVEVTA